MITMICSVSSLIYVSFKAAVVFGEPVVGGYFRTEEVALFVCSWILAIGHIVVAYRTSCRERRKLLVFKIDIESVSFSTFFIVLYPSQLFFLSRYKNIIIIFCLKVTFSRYRNIMGNNISIKNKKRPYQFA